MVSNGPTPRGASGKPVVPATLFDQTVAACALSRVLAGDVIHRACTRAGVDPGALSTDELRRALPSIRKALGIFLTPDDVESSMARIHSLAQL